MNVNLYVIKDYENVPLRRRGENKPNQTQFTKCPQAWGLNMMETLPLTIPIIILYHFVNNEGATQMFVSKLLR